MLHVRAGIARHAGTGWRRYAHGGHRLAIYQNSGLGATAVRKVADRAAKCSDLGCEEVCKQRSQADRGFCVMRVTPVAGWWVEFQQFLNPVSTVGLTGEA